MNIMPLEEVEKDYILRAMKEEPNISKLALKLRIGRSSLYRRFKKWGIPFKRERKEHEPEV